MLPTLTEMMEAGLLTPAEAEEANHHSTSNPETFLAMPAPPLRKVWAAWHLLDFDPQEAGATRH